MTGLLTTEPKMIGLETLDRTSYVIAGAPLRSGNYEQRSMHLDPHLA